MSKELPVPDFYQPEKVGEIWNIHYQKRFQEAIAWRKKHKIVTTSSDDFKICLMIVDAQNTFCIPGFEMFVAGRTGTAAVDDNHRLCEFIYKNLHVITQICPTMDTHQAMQIFHSIFLINKRSEHPEPFSLISYDEIRKGKWKFNQALCESLDIDKKYGQKYLEHYSQKLKESGKYDLTIWPYHAMLGGIGHALVPAIEETIFFHTVTRYTQPDFQIKGNNAFTENYSVLSPEVLEDQEGNTLSQRNTSFVQKLLQFDAVLIAGQAKSHCVAWTIEDLLKSIKMSDKNLAQKVYLLQDCMSPVVIPEVIDYTDTANEAFKRFADSGMNIVNSTQPMSDWPGMKL